MSALPLPAGMVTFVFTDIEGSTRLFRELADDYVVLLERHHELLRACWRAHDGREVKTEGDAFFVAFSDPASAIDACVAAQRSLAAEVWPGGADVRVRMGVHAGLAYPRGDDYVAYAVHQAARVVAAGHGGQVLVSSDAAAVISRPARSPLRSLGRYRLRDFDEPVELFAAGPDAPPFPAPRAVPADGHNLVRPRTTFVGRDRELLELTEAIGSGRLVTIAGPGGIGKTRLVVEWGLGHTDEWPDGVWMVELAAIIDRVAVSSAAAEAVGVSVPRFADVWEEVLGWLANRRAVIVFDNCEHVIDEVAACVDALLDRCPHVAVVTTSREPLGVAGEVVWRLGPLDATRAGVELFVQRARVAARGFEASTEDAEAIGELCTRLDGLPLAIELAAARVSVVSPAQILAGLDGRFQHLQQRHRGVPERQRTIQALLDWSWDLLTPDEQRALARLSLFVAGFDHDAATAAIAWGELIDADITGLLLSLLDKSLIVIDATNGHRSKLLETVRAYAKRRLDELDDSARLARALSAHYLARYGLQDWRAGSHDRMSALAVDLENLGACIEALSSADAGAAQELACVIVRRSRTLDPPSALGRGLRYLEALPAQMPARVALLGQTTLVASDHLDAELATRLLDEAEELRTSVGQPVWAENRLEQLRGLVAVITGDPAAGVAIGERALREAATPFGRGLALNLLSIAYAELERFTEARAAADEELSIRVEAEDLEAAVVAAGNAAEAAMGSGDLPLAAARQQLSLGWALQLGLDQYIAFATVLAARLAREAGDWAIARRLQRGADAILDGLGLSLYPSDRALCDELLAEAARQLGDSQDAANQDGEAKPDIVELANEASAIFDRWVPALAVFRESGH